MAGGRNAPSSIDPRGRAKRVRRARLIGRAFQARASASSVICVTPDESFPHTSREVPPPRGLSSEEAARRLSTDGPNEVPEERRHPLARLASKFWGVSAWMIELIVVLSFVLGKMADAWIAVGLLVVNAAVSFFEEEHAYATVKSLRSRLQVTVRALRDDHWQLVGARELVRDDVIRVRMGDFVPADVTLTEGELGVDQSTLTGESREQARGVGTLVYAGSIVRRGEATGVVSATGTRTYYGRTIQLVEHAHPVLHTEAVTRRLARWLFLVVGALVAVSFVVAFARGLPLAEILPLSLVLLLGAVPVALPVMFTVSMAVSSTQLARQGVIVTRLSATEDAASMDVLCADKTGTLTWNKLSFVDAIPNPQASRDDIIRAGAWASHEADQDPIDLAFLTEARRSGLIDGHARQLSFVPFSPQTRRTEALVEMSSGRVRVTKGSLRAVADVAGLDAATITGLEAKVSTNAARGVRALAVAEAPESGTWRFLGIALLEDAPRPDSRRVIEELRELGVGTKMLTGDALPVAREIGAELGLPEIVRASHLQEGAPAEVSASLVGRADGFAEIYPEDKLVVVKSFQDGGHVVGMTGDGVNDAPALRQAEVGIAVGGATDVAKESASVVLTTGGLEPIVELVRGGRAVHERVLTWIINKISRAVLKTSFVAVVLVTTGELAISAFGMILLLFMTDFVKVSLATDRVVHTPRPASWTLRPWFIAGGILGVLMMIEALGVLLVATRWLGGTQSADSLHGLTFELLLFFALFSIVSIRERRAFWSSRPGKALAVVLVADAIVGVSIGLLGIADLRPLPLPLIVLIVVAAAVFVLGVNDMIKRALIARLTLPNESNA